ncbi:DUF1800 domain-containing protein [Pontibacter cellulosilyticus]|uniref:DUF1800 domain-containing protein n=1 Tax=Pontibacter cellulosilyticus TaxID=1720253 RepID=A0A923N441_9BACT|nr:DUF1800 domain-containing protein [Pontibacter cellulosilyticus]MBC5991514.1 DUF1800 domain-containing protein [Pontibacter cellulosilyticus]
MKAIPFPQQLRHLSWRAGFGPTPATAESARNIKQAVKQLFKASEKTEFLQVPMPAPVDGMRAKDLGPEQRRKQLQERRQALMQLNRSWLNQMVTSEAQLREKMTLFWHGHFACRLQAPQLLQLQNNTLRKHALGSFSDLLTAVAKDPAMLQFLNNQQNRKQRPNENFAREVLELFTIGRGNYTEQDIKEAARAFTGWGYNAEGEYVFRERQHDFGPKTFMGQTGNFNGEDILRIILQDPRTANYLTTKLYLFFVSDTPHPQRIKELSSYFYKLNYNIAGLLEQIFTANWFYTPEVMGARIKSPVELLAGLQRMFDVSYSDDRSVLVLQRALGQELFQPPNVSGWAGGQSWIDSSTLAFRLRIGPAVLQDAGIEVALKPNDDQEPAKPIARRADGLRIARAKANISLIEQQMAKVDTSELPEQLSSFLLQVPLQPHTLQILKQGMASSSSKSEQIHYLAQRLLSLPEYQLC